MTNLNRGAMLPERTKKCTIENIINQNYRPLLNEILKEKKNTLSERAEKFGVLQTQMENSIYSEVFVKTMTDYLLLLGIMKKESLNFIHHTNGDVQ